MQTHDDAHHDHGAGHEPAGVTDPVCGMTVDPAHAAATSEHDGHTYYFCSPGCRDQFEADPDRYTTAHNQGAHT